MGTNFISDKFKDFLQDALIWTSGIIIIQSQKQCTGRRICKINQIHNAKSVSILTQMSI